MKIIVTGFMPFGGETQNPSNSAVFALPDEICGAQIIKLQLPVDITCFDALQQAIIHHNADCVVCCGQAGGRSGITIEKVAINCFYASPADVKNKVDTNIIETDQADGLFSTLNVEAMAKAIRDKSQLPATVSYSAGTYICNFILYKTLSFAKKHRPSLQAAFIHIPFLPCQTASKPSFASMSLSDDVRAIEAALQAVALHLHSDGGAFATCH